MNGEMETLCLRLRDLARQQKAAFEAANLDEILTLAETRQGVLQEIQKTDGSPGAAAGSGRSDALAAVLREILTIDKEAEEIARVRMQDISLKLSKINTFKVFFRDIADGAGAGGGISNR